MKPTILALGAVGALALTTLLYRVYKIENNLGTPARPARTTGRLKGRRGTARRPPGEFDPGDAGPQPSVPSGRPIPRSMIKGSSMQRPAPGQAAAAPSARRSPLQLLWPPAVVMLFVVAALLLQGDYRIATTLGIVQGLGEPLPISSSAHLILTPWFFGWDGADTFFNTQWYDVALHVGTLLAFGLFFWRDWLRLILNAHRPQSTDGRLFWLLVLASLPGAAIGFVLDRLAEDYFRERYLVIAAALAVMGVILYLVDSLLPQRDELQDIGWHKALLIGLAQSLAFVPGVSRSGSTITMGRALGLTRETAARFSFLMSMPITFGAVLLKSTDVDAQALRSAPFWLGIGTSFVVGSLAIGFLLRYVRTNSYLPFVIYRLGLAAAVVLVYFLRR